MANREMKYSGVEWIGEIPKRWEVMKFKYVMKKDKKIAKKYNNENVISLTKSGVIIRDLENPFGKMPASFDGYQHVEEGDLLLCLFDIDVTPRCVGIVKNNGVTSPAYSRYKLMDGFDINYYNYLLTYLDDEKILLSYTKSLRNTLTDEYFGAVSTIKPSLLEQQKIAAFLDEKVAHIDNIIEDTKKSIENLKAYKQSLITETVTKGLDPNVEVKDSEIEWVGYIPKHWVIYRISQMFREHKEKNEGLIEDNLLSLSYGKVKRRDIKSKEGLLPQSFEGYNIIQPGDIVLRMTDLQNDQKSLRVGLCEEKGIITSAYITIRSYNNMYPHYAYYYLHSFDIYKGFYGMGAGVRQGVNFNELKKLDILFPTYDEQKQIAEFLDEKSRTIDSTIEQKNQLVIELESYKKSFIYEYVTGKKEVK